jgi:hypothetical protein
MTIMAVPEALRMLSATVTCKINNNKPAKPIHVPRNSNLLSPELGELIFAIYRWRFI